MDNGVSGKGLAMTALPAMSGAAILLMPNCAG
jgi:hypothetical protein